MKNVLLTGLAIAALTFASSCKKELDSNSNEGFGKRNAMADYTASALPVQTVSGDITANTTWDNTKVWEINGILTVKNGATLTINPGTFVKSSINAPNVPNGIIIVQKGAKINAVGTPENPIVFTSRYLLDGNAATLPNPGDFGGIVLLGKARVNTGVKDIEGIPQNGYQYGGLDDADNSGTIRYIRIEYPGYILSPDNAISGLTCGAVGKNTVLDHIEVSYSQGDSFGFFGGSVNASFLISKAPVDDNFDFNNGYNGAIDFALAVADQNSGHSTSAGSSDSNGIESDNNYPAEGANYNLVPKTHPVLSNFTIVGTVNANNGYKFAIRNRRGAEIELYDSIITGYPSGLVFEYGTEAFLTNGVSQLSGNDFHGFNAAVTPAGTFPGNSLSTLANAPKYDMVQPFLNAGVLNFSGAFNGAFAKGISWTVGWSVL